MTRTPMARTTMARTTTRRILAGLAAGTVITAGLGLAQPATAYGTDPQLSAGQTLAWGETLSSPSQQHNLRVGPTVEIEGLVVDGLCDPWVLVNVPREARPTLRMQDDGNLVLYSNGAPVWHTGTYGHPGAYATMQDDGNLVVYGTDSKPLWQSRTMCNRMSNTSGLSGTIDDRFLMRDMFMQDPTRQYKLIMQHDGNLVLYKGTKALWQSNTRGSGNYMHVQANNDVTVRDSNGKVLWHSNTAVRTTGQPPAVFLNLQSDGNLVLYRYDSTGGANPAWHTRTHQN